MAVGDRMRLKVPKELLLLNAVTVLFVLAITLLPSSTLRFILGVPFLLFVPGYALIAALFPRKKQIDTEVLLRDSCRLIVQAGTTDIQQPALTYH